MSSAETAAGPAVLARLGEAEARRLVWVLIAIGTVVRLLVGFTTDGFLFERQSYELVRAAVTAHPLHVYALVNGGTFHYPYPPGYLPWIWFVGELAPGG